MNQKVKHPTSYNILHVQVFLISIVITTVSIPIEVKTSAKKAESWKDPRT